MNGLLKILGLARRIRLGTAPPSRRNPPQGRTFGRRVGAVLGLVILACLPLGWLGWLAISWVPLPRELRGPVNVGRSVELADRHGTSLRVRPGMDGRIGREFAETEVATSMVVATVAAEDSRFFRHGGVDFLATGRAAAQWWRHRRIVSGASTITQQLIKQVEPRPRTLRTKFLEWVQAWRLEREWDKAQILQAYLGRIDYGNGCLGLGEAARHYFGKRAADLDLAESAFLAGLPQAPTRLNPRRQFARAKARQEWILGRCRQLESINDVEYRRALARPIRLVPSVREFAAPHFVDQVLAAPGWGPAVAMSGRVRTTLDLPLQQRCEQIVKRQLAELGRFHVEQAAVVVLENRTGSIRALLGSADWFESERGQVNGVWARRSPGSALKPFTYLLALQDGVTAAEVIPDVPTEFATSTGVFRPANYDRHFRGPVSVREALANSLNVPAVRMLAEHGGPERLQAFLKSFGLTTLERDAGDYGLGLTLGNAEVRLLELANAYATLARLGEWLPVRWMEDGSTGTPRRVASSGACWLVTDILQDAAARSSAFGLETPLRFDFPVACKTGTSTGYRDNWALGFTADYTVGVWVGNFDGTPMQDVSGVMGAAPILHEVFGELRARFGTQGFVRPAEVEEHWVEPLTGHRVPAGGGARREVFLAGASPPAAVPDDYDGQGRVWLSSEYREWVAAADSRLGARVVLREPGQAPGEGPMRILCPLPGTVYFLDADLPDSAQRLTLRTTKACTWECPSLVLRQQPGHMEAQLAVGRHQLVAKDPQGQAAVATWIEVRRL